MEGLVLLGLGAALGVIFGWAAFFMGLNANSRLARVEKELAALKRSANEAPPQTAAPQMRPEPTEPDDVVPVAEPLRAPAPDDESDAGPTREKATPGAAQEAAPVSAKPSRAEKFGEALAGNWLIWLGGAALVLGGAFLVKAAVDAGFFGPIMRVASALAAGATMLGGAQWLRLGGAPEKSLAPPVLAGAGGATIYGAIYAAYGLYNLIPPLLAFVLLAGASAGLVVFAVLHRSQAMAGLAIVGAHLSPVLAGGGGPPGAPFYVYIFAISAGGLVVSQFMQWRLIAWFALAGGLFWPLVFIAMGEVGPPLPLAIYLPAFLAMAAVIVWDAAVNPVDVNAVRKSGAPLSLVVFAVALLGAVAAALLFTLSEGFSGVLIFMWAAFSLLTLAGARLREGFSLAPAIVAAGFAVTIALADTPRLFPLFEVGAAFAAFFAIGGYLVMRLSRESGPAAFASAFGPAAILCGLFYAEGGFEQAPVWGFASILIAFFNISVLAELYRRRGGFDGAPGVAAAYGLGAALATALAVAMSLDGLAMSFGFAIQAPVIAWLWRRFQLPALRYAASALAALGALRLLFLPDVLDEAVGAAPIANLLLLAYLAPAAGFWLAARWFEGGGLSRRGAVVQGMEAAAISLFAVFVSLEIRHLMNSGDIGVDYNSLIEISIQTISWVLIGTFLRWRFGADLTPIRAFAEKALLALAALQTAGAPLGEMNPWWGATTPLIEGPPIVNFLALYFLAPAAAFGLAAYIARRTDGVLQSRIAGLFALLLAYAWCILSVRHQFHAPDLSAGAIGDAESWGYSIVTILFATGLLVAAAFRRSAVLRFGGLAVLMGAVAKVFIFDMAGLEGVWRATSFLGLGAALVGIAVLHQRVLAPMMAEPERP